MLCLSFPSSSFYSPSPRLFLPPSLSLVAWRRSVGAERSRLVKRLADDKKIRGISLLTGCCVCSFFFFSSSIFFCFKCFLSVCFQSSCLGSTISATSPCTHMHTHAQTHSKKSKNHTHAKTHVQVFCVLTGDRSDFVFSDWWQWEEGEEPYAHKDVFPSANYRDRLWLPVWKQVFKQL